MTPPRRDLLLPAVQAVVEPLPRRGLVLAVSGGRDSSVLLHAIVRAGLADRLAIVATFNHRTGVAAEAAVAHVTRLAASLGVPAIAGRASASMQGASEAEWRAARWDFLQQVGRGHQARVATAHTRDDQLETVAFRLLRGAGARGLAGLDVDGGPVRPLLRVSRAAVAQWASDHALEWVEDPSNEDRRFARVRLRRDILPALERAHPGFGDSLLASASEAAAWRREVEGWVNERLTIARVADGVQLGGVWLEAPQGAGAEVIWPVAMARAGVRLDRRGIARLAAFGASAGLGDRLPLAGGAEMVAVHGGWLVRALQRTEASTQGVTLQGEVGFGGWHFSPAQGSAEPTDGWSAALPADTHLVVRAWAPGDRMLGPGGLRRVKRFLADARIPGPLRDGWPVVASGDNILWIPGVRRATPATDSGARPTLRYVCERRSF